MLSYTDQLGNIISLNAKPKRIVSLVPSQTELLFDLGLDEEVIGITKFCIHPDRWFRSKIRIGGTKNVNIEKIKALQPDLIIANKEENVKEQVEELKKIAPVWVSDIYDLNDALSMISSIGELTGRVSQSTQIINNIRQNFTNLATTSQYSTAYLIWKDPYMAAGGDTFINHMLQHSGFGNVFSDINRYPEINIEMLRSSGCDLIFLSSEPYPFKEKHITELQQQLPGKRILLVDGEMFSWYGSRLQFAPAYFKELLLTI